MKSKKPLLLSALAALALAGCAGGEKASLEPGGPDRPPNPLPGIEDSARVIRPDDMIKIVLRRPGSTLGSLEPVGKDGNVSTPDGARVPAAGMTLGAFRQGLEETYRRLPSNEGLTAEVWIWSSPYRIIRYRAGASPAPATGTNRPPATVFPYVFRAPITVWEAIRLDGGLPGGVDPSKIRVLKRDLGRRTLDCSGRDGGPDGRVPLESGDTIFLVPEGAPLSTIFD